MIPKNFDAEAFHAHAFASAARWPRRIAIETTRGESLTYREFEREVRLLARLLLARGLRRGDRVGVYLGKDLLSCVAPYAVSVAGGVFVPINSALKNDQVMHIVVDCEMRVLITNPERLSRLSIADDSTLRAIFLTAPAGADTGFPRASVDVWRRTADVAEPVPARAAEQGVPAGTLAALFYTSGSTGRAKGVMLSHDNLIAGIHSVLDYLELAESDRLLAALPFSFDYGFNQLSSALAVGGCCVLLDYLLPNDIIKALADYQITGLAGVPTLWCQLAEFQWPAGVERHLRYFTNSGGSLAPEVLDKVRALFPEAAPVLMYGLTEAFRSTYLEPALVDEKRGSIGKAIPGAEVLVLTEANRPAEVGVPGELVHCGRLVTLGYWNNPQATAERFKPVLDRVTADGRAEIGVWSGDIVRSDEDGFLYFIGRRDGMLKTSGFRVSPEEVEQCLYQHAAVVEAAAFGVPHATLGDAIIAAVRGAADEPIDTADVLKLCRRILPGYMVPKRIVALPALPHNPNGKVDRKALAATYRDILAEPPMPQPRNP